MQQGVKSQLLASVADVDTAVPGMGHPMPVRLSRIKPDPNQPRKTFDDDSIAELADMIQAEGQKTPLRVRPDPNQKGSFIIIAGERRWRAFQLIAQRTGKESMINCLFEIVEPKRHFREAFIDNLQREDLTPLDTAAGLYKMHYEEEERETISGLAKLCGKSTSWVENYIKLHGLPEEVKRLMDLKRPEDLRLNVTSAIDIARSTPDAQLRISIARETIERRLNVNDTRTLISMRTGAEGWRVGGFQRKSADDYKSYTSFLGRTRQDVERHLKLSYESLYFDRDDEASDREEDALKIEHIIGAFQEMLKKVKEEQPLR